MNLPYDNTYPVTYDNDAVCDMYTGDYLMPLASAGDIRLVAMMTSSSIAPDPPISLHGTTNHRLLPIPALSTW